MVYLCLLWSSLSLRDYGKPLLTNPRNTVALKLLPRPFRAQQIFFLGLYINLTREATLCQNILNVLRIFARISKFRFFHETKQTQNEVGRFFTTWPNLFSNTFTTVGEFKQLFQSFASIRFSQHDRTVTQIPNTSSNARSRSSSSPTLKGNFSFINISVEMFRF